MRMHAQALRGHLFSRGHGLYRERGFRSSREQSSAPNLAYQPREPAGGYALTQ